MLYHLLFCSPIVERVWKATGSLSKLEFHSKNKNSPSEKPAMQITPARINISSREDRSIFEYLRENFGSNAKIKTTPKDRVIIQVIRCGKRGLL